MNLLRFFKHQLESKHTATNKNFFKSEDYLENIFRLKC